MRHAKWVISAVLPSALGLPALAAESTASGPRAIPSAGPPPPGARAAPGPPQEAGGGIGFLDVTAAAGIPTVITTGDAFPEGDGFVADLMQRNMGSGAAAGDYDGDGDLDLYLLAYEGHPNALLRNNLIGLGEKTFTDVTGEAGVGDLGLSRVAHFADLDNDGDLDLILANDNTEDASHPPSKLFRNNGDGTFSDVTAGSGFQPLGYLRCGMSLADYDGDGLLDVHVSNWSFALVFDVGEPLPLFPGSDRLYRNLGDFHFEDVTESSGMGVIARDSFTSIFQDFDGDHRPDLYVAFDHTSDEFFWNRPEGFVRATEEVGTSHLGNDMGAACADFDDDGDLDLYTTNITGAPFANGSGGNCFYVNRADELGETVFENQAEAFGIEDTYFGWGVEFTDLDNDGDLDLFAVSGFDEWVLFRAGENHRLYHSPPVLFVNDGTPAFARVLAPGIDIVDDSRGLIVFDYDRDGDQDLLITNLAEPPRLLENVTGPPAHWLDVAVRQARGNNRQGIGATVRIVLDGVVKRREILAGRSYLAGTPAEAHFGLGATAMVGELRVEWTDGTETVLTAVPADQLLRIQQPLAGDVDGDDDVDFQDLLALLAAWGDCPEPPEDCPADINGDGTVGFEDLLVLLGNWG